MHPQPDAIFGVTCEGQDVTWADIEAAVEDVKDWLQLKLTSGSFSLALAYQLAGHCCRMPQLLGNRALLADVTRFMIRSASLRKRQ